MRRTAYALIALATLYGAAALGNYSATQGSGTDFGSIVVSAVHYAQQLVCDSVVPSRCVTVSAAGAAKVDGSAVTQPVSGTVTANIGTVGTLATAANQATEIASLASIDTKVGSAIPAGSAIIGKVGIDQTTPGTTNGVQVNAALPAGTNVIGTVNQSSQYPVGATAITASATGTTAATTATLAGTSGKTTYICGYSIRANATAAATVTNTITGVITATMSSIMWVAPLASGIGIDEQIFSPCIPASATNTGIAIVSGAPGSGGTVSSKGWGYQL